MSVSSNQAPQSPRVRNIRQALYKKSPVRSPLRQMIKSRCQERMKADRDRIVSGVRKIDLGDGRAYMENTVKMFLVKGRAFSVQCNTTPCIVLRF